MSVGKDFKVNNFVTSLIETVYNGKAVMDNRAEALADKELITYLYSINNVQKCSNFVKSLFTTLKEGAKFNHAHTIIIHYNNTEVKNIFETPVTEEQMMGRSLMKAFTTAVAQARFSFGKDVSDVPVPIVIHCVQTDGKRFHFSVFQLNSADILSKQRNIYWSLPLINLYEECSYVEGLPVLDGYNPNVFKYLKAFYNNN